MTPSWLRVSDGAVTVEVVARPGASRNGFHRVTPQGLVIGINAAPEKGMANAELMAFLAKMLGLPRTSVTILKGESSRHKIIRVEAESPADVADRLMGLVDPLLAGE